MKISRVAVFALGLMTAACAGGDEAEETPAVEETTPLPAPAPAPMDSMVMDSTMIMDSTTTTTGL